VFHSPNPTAIVWTQTTPAYQTIVFDGFQASIPVISSWIERAFDLASIRALGDNWDGFGSEAPDHSVIEKANAFFRVLQDRDFTNPPMRVGLSPNGSIAFEWLEQDAFLRAELGDSEEVEWMRAAPGQPTNFRLESLAPSRLEAPEGQAWKTTPAPVGGLAYACAH
jgi:hypothetical protein